MITKTRLAILIVAMVAVSTTTAYATHVFTDVEDGRFYAEATEWAKDNGITFGCGDGTTFCPDDPVTRGENITFAKRYDDNIVQPALSDINDELDMLGPTGVERIDLDFFTTSTTAVELTKLSVEAPGKGTLVIEVAGQYWLDLDAGDDNGEFGYVQLAICDTADSLSETDCGDSFTDARYEDPDDANTRNATPGIATARVVTVDAAGTVDFYINGLSETGAGFQDWYTYAKVTFYPGTNAFSGALSAS